MSDLTQDTQLHEKAEAFVQNNVFCLLPPSLRNIQRMPSISEDICCEFASHDVLQYLIITDSSVAEALSEHGEAIFDFDYFSVWGRTTCGQKVYLDGIFQDALGLNDDEAKVVINRCVEDLPNLLEDALFKQAFRGLQNALDRLHKMQYSSGDFNEILEYWLVSRSLGRELLSANECVVDLEGCYLWGRTESGQAICMDSVIREIVESNSY